MKENFVPFLDRVLPPLVKAASYRPRPQHQKAAGQFSAMVLQAFPTVALIVLGLSEEDAGEAEEDVLKAQTSELEDKILALGALADYAITLRGHFAPVVKLVMPVALDSLSIRESYEVREVSLALSEN